MPEISIIVPVYRAEQTLERCIDSILAQTFQDFELILVEDGSPDHSGMLCDACAEKDARIRVIHQENRGAAAARHRGLQTASGESVIFPDSDDWMASDLLEILRRALRENRADYVAAGFTRDAEGIPSVFESNGIASGIYDLSKPEKSDFLHRVLYNGSFYVPGILPSLWSKLIRRRLLESIPPPADDLAMGDDAAVAYPALARAERVAILNECRGYHYRVLSSSLSNTYDPRYFERAETLIRHLKTSLTSCPQMLESLPYYTLFILQLGMDLYLFHNRRTGRPEKEATLAEAYRIWLISIGEDVDTVGNDISEALVRAPSFEVSFSQKERIDWRGFSSSDEALLRPFLAGDFDAVISRYAKKHFSATIRSVLGL